MRNIRCEEILSRKEYSYMSETNFEKEVSNYCKSKLNEFDTAPSKLESLKIYPEKKYEVFCLNYISGGKAIFMLDTNEIKYNEELDEKELYYSSVIGKKICDNLKRINEDAIVGIAELEQMQKENIDKIKEEIESLRELDEDEFNLDRYTYVTLENTDILEEIDSIKNSDEKLLKENEELKKKLKSSEKQIKDLSKKLKVSLEDIEKNREKLQLHTSSKFEKLMNSIKNFFE